MPDDNSVLNSAITLADIAHAVGGIVNGDDQLTVYEVARPDRPATNGQLVLALDPRRIPKLQLEGARCALVAKGVHFPASTWSGWVEVERPRSVLARLLPLFERPLGTLPGIHPSAVVEPTAEIAADASIGPLCYVGHSVVVESGARILSQCTLGAECRIGANSLLYPGVRIGDRVMVGRRVIVHGNACIGADGFSFAPTNSTGAEGSRGGKAVDGNAWELERIPSLGSVVIEDDVEIGACSTIDRGTLEDTIIGRNSKLDNLVMVGHNTRVGEFCLIAGQSGIAGSCEVGNRVALGGQCGVTDHVKIGANAVLMARTGVSGPIPPRSLSIDTPATPYERWRDRYRSLSRLKRLLVEVETLKNRLWRLEKKVVGPSHAGPREVAGPKQPDSSICSKSES
jgi:UDP-3-O-[3-hydroxymyristoyl] glucosamine N-acyltransferase